MIFELALGTIGLRVASRKFDVLKINICPRSEASRANMLVLKHQISDQISDSS